MLKQSEADALSQEIKEEQKDIMKSILNNARLIMEEKQPETFKTFKKLVFDSFGKSGLETSVQKSIQKYVE